MKPEHFAGIIVKKYRNNSDHGARTIVNSKTEEIEVDWYSRAFYDAIEPGDSVVKQSGAYKITLYKVDTTIECMPYSMTRKEEQDANTVTSGKRR